MVTVTPAAGQTGTATITVTVSDGMASASDWFVVTVNAATIAISTQPAPLRARRSHCRSVISPGA